MKNVRDEHAFFSTLFNLLSNQLGPTLELVLYDLTSPGGPEIVDLRNGHITGGTGGIYQELLQAKGRWPFPEQTQFCNVIYKQEGGVVLRCSAICVYGEGNRPIGCVSMNQDITKTLKAERLIHELNQYHGDSGGIFSGDINSILDTIINETSQQVGVPYEDMTKEDKVSFIRLLDRRGAFMVTKAGDRICALLGISKYTMYTYLDIARNTAE